MVLVQLGAGQAAFSPPMVSGALRVASPCGLAGLPHGLAAWGTSDHFVVESKAKSLHFVI